jgi:uncharacterized hydrophobic protein (TIGR00271 family)
LRDWFAGSLGVTIERKGDIYIDISRSATLRDPSYWLQVIFSAGIATLGLVLNSVAVIIGAMLISPLMGSILANGLALATGDLTLGLRALTNLLLSCLLAVAFAMVLVAILPFKELTQEIAARTRPNTLDLVIALFSGAVGSVAICKELKGVATSIPGVAIAVALMPPLCVAGYGFGLAVSLNQSEGMQVARGGGLLFLTNLFAITFTAMIVFIGLHIDMPSVKDRVRAWREQDLESAWIDYMLRRLPAADRLSRIGSLPGRFFLIVLPLLLLLIPLSDSLDQLRTELTLKQQENEIKAAAKEIWQENFATMPTGEPRSYIGDLSTVDDKSRLSLQLRIFTSKSYTSAEKAEYTKLIATRLNRPPDSVSLQLIEIPTATSELLTRSQEPTELPTPAPTVPQLQASFLGGVASALQDLTLPPPAQLIDYDVTTSLAQPLRVGLWYLSEREISVDARNLIAADVRHRVEYPTADVALEWVATVYGPLPFSRNHSALVGSDSAVLDRIGAALQRHPSLRLDVAADAEEREREGIAAERARVVADYLVKAWRIAPDRMTSTSGTADDRSVRLTVRRLPAAP